MAFEYEIVAYVLLSMVIASVVSFLMTPVVRSFAYRVGAIDVPRDARRMHKVPTPRLGGLAIFGGFMVSTLLFVRMTPELKSVMLGAVVIVVLGVVDDSVSLPAKLKFVVQIFAALIPALNGVTIRVFSNPNVFSDDLYWNLGRLSIPLTVLWIVAVTNSVNLIDGLDGLANGVSTISAVMMLIIALLLGETDVSLILAALVGACMGFMPYNLNPAKMFMGDTGATFLGYILATMSIQGLFKYYAVISFVAPFLILGLPIFDTAFAFFRRLAQGRSPMQADREHIHHRLIDMGLNQKQAVATLYVISAILGLSAVVLTTGGEQRAMLLFAALCIGGVVAARLVFPQEIRAEFHRNGEKASDAPSSTDEPSPTDTPSSTDAPSPTDAAFSADAPSPTDKPSGTDAPPQAATGTQPADAPSSTEPPSGTNAPPPAETPSPTDAASGGTGAPHKRRKRRKRKTVKKPEITS